MSKEERASCEGDFQTSPVFSLPDLTCHLSGNQQYSKTVMHFKNTFLIYNSLIDFYEEILLPIKS